MRGITGVLFTAAWTASSALAPAAGGLGDLPGVDFDATGPGVRGLLMGLSESCIMRRAFDGEIDLASLVNAGRTKWKVIDDNAALPDCGKRFASAIPEGLGDGRRLCQWSPAEGDRFEFETKDLLGRPAVRVTYQVTRITGGRYAGKGRFLTGVSVLPIRIEAKAGYKASMEAEVLAVNNVGTARDPVAAIVLAARWRVRGQGREHAGASVFLVRGDGLFSQLRGW
ncbi:MAG: hypothetical protein HY748_01110 [Elusimicrobia bacterium]|nr:hypothetical protein [Elusimicrobiota bacterium]